MLKISVLKKFKLVKKIYNLCQVLIYKIISDLCTRAKIIFILKTFIIEFGAGAERSELARGPRATFILF